MDEKRLRQFRELGLTISYYRRLKGLTQTQLADLVGLSRTHISNIEAPKVKTSLSLDSLFDIADALDVQVKELFNFKG
nr:helix-turn-helix transcriptional regulator [uncultured Blautia sp.]